MKSIPNTELALVLRTDFSDTPAWLHICSLIRKPVGFFRFKANVEFLDDPDFDDIAPEQMLTLIPPGYNHNFIVLVDHAAITLPDHPLLLVDLYESSGNQFRAIPKMIQSIENNLSISNMDFEEFANSVDVNGVFRGFPGG